MLKEKFEEYLQKELKSVPNCQSKTELFDELLDEMLTMALEFEERSESDIYKICTERMRDFSADVKIIKQDPKVKLKDNRLKRDVLLAMSSVLFATVLYLIIGFACNEWAVSAMVIFPAIIGLIYIYSVSKVLIYNIKENVHGTTGLIIGSFVLIATLVLYFTLTFGFDLNAAKTWCIFIIMVALFGIVHIVTQIAFRKKMVHPFALMIEVILVSLAVYLTVACILWSFHPYWIIMVVAVLLDVVFGIYLINKKMSK